MNNAILTTSYRCKVYECGTNKEITEPERVLDISMFALIGDRDQPLHSSRSPDYCAIVRASKRGYILVKADAWPGSHVIQNGNEPAKYVFHLPIQSVQCTPSISHAFPVLHSVAPILATQLIHPDQTQTVEYHYTHDTDKGSTVGGIDQPLGHYRVVIQGPVGITM